MCLHGVCLKLFLSSPPASGGISCPQDGSISHLSEARCLLRLNAAFKNKQGRKRGEMQLWKLTKQKLGGKKQTRLHRTSSKQPCCRVVVCVVLILLSEPAQFFQASADTSEHTSGGTAGDWAGPGRCLYSFYDPQTRREESSIHEPSACSHSSRLLHGTKCPVCFCSGGAAGLSGLDGLRPTSALSQLHRLVPAVIEAHLGGGGGGESNVLPATDKVRPN